MIFTNAFSTAVPHASAFIHTEDNDAAIADRLDAVNHALLHAHAILFKNSPISLSVVAKLFPSATTVEDNLSISLNGSHRILDILAKLFAAVSAVKSVVSAILAIDDVNLPIFSVSTHNCQANSAIFDNSENEFGKTVFSSFSCCFTFCKSDVEPSTVFLTHANADSNSIAVLTVLLIALHNHCTAFIAHSIATSIAASNPRNFPI